MGKWPFPDPEQAPPQTAQKKPDDSGRTCSYQHKTTMRIKETYRCSKRFEPSPSPLSSIRQELPPRGDYVLKEQGLDSELECLPFETGDETTTYMLLRQDESGEKLKKIIDDSLKTLIENGTLKELSEKYLDGDYAPQL